MADTKLGAPTRLRRIGIGTATGLLVAGALYLAWGDEVYVSCAPAPGAYSCSVEHRAGFNDVTACWTVALTCRNGEAPTARQCTAIEANSVQSVAVPETLFGPELERCDQIVETAIRALRVNAI